MPVQKFVSEKIQVGVADYVGIWSMNGGVFIQTLKQLETPNPDWRDSYEETINVSSSYSTSFDVPAGHNFNLNLKKLSSDDQHLVSLTSSGTDINYPDIIVNNFEGDLPYSNKSIHTQVVTLTIVPISSHADSKYKIKFNPVYEWPMAGKNIIRDIDAEKIAGYSSGRSGPYVVWDNLRHQSAKLDFTFGYSNGEVLSHTTIVVNSYDSHSSLLPYHFNKKGISKVDILLTTTIESDVGIYSIISKKSKIPENTTSLYQNYIDNYVDFNNNIAAQKAAYDLDQRNNLATISSNDTTTTY